MCNFYIMYYTDNNGIKLEQSECWNKAPSSLSFPLSSEDVTDLVPQYDVTMATDWVLNGVADEALQTALGGIKVGQISGISVTKDAVYMLHRGVHVWDAQ